MQKKYFFVKNVKPSELTNQWGHFESSESD